MGTELATYDHEIRRDLSRILDMSSRADEKLKAVIERLADQDRRIQSICDGMSLMQNRLTIVESKQDVKLRSDVDTAKDSLLALDHRLAHLELIQTSEASKWKTGAQFGLQLLLGVLTAYLIYKLQIQTP